MVNKDLAGFPTGRQQFPFDRARGLPYTSLFVRDVTNLSGAVPVCFGTVSWKEYLRSRNMQDGMGRKSGRNGAPAPQSRVSLSELIPRDQLYLLECVRSFLLVVPPDSQWTFQHLRTLSRIFVCAPGESHEVFARKSLAAVWPKKREDSADVFAAGPHGP